MTDSTDDEGYSQFSTGDRRPEVRTLLFELAHTDFEDLLAMCIYSVNVCTLTKACFEVSRTG